MSSQGFEPPLRFEPRASLRALALLSAAHLLAAAALISVVPLIAAVVVAALVGVGFAVEWGRARQGGVLEWSSSGEWWVDGSGPWRIGHATVLTPWLVVLVLEGDGRRRIALFPDSLPTADWRRLRARLRRHPIGD